jgi:prepilin signal peptidase PulO-like enzyme (type II secretory pathway)
MKELKRKLNEILSNLNEKQKKYLYIGIASFVLLIILIILWNIGIKTGIIPVSFLPVFFTTLFVIIIPFIVVVVLTIIFARRYFEVKKILLSYEKTFGLLYDEVLDLDEKEILMYQNYLDEDN